MKCVQWVGKMAIRRDITLSKPYDEKLTARMQARGVSRSEAVRQLLDQAESSAGVSDAVAVRGRLNNIRMRIAMILERVSLPDLRQHAREIEKDADALTRELFSERA